MAFVTEFGQIVHSITLPHSLGITANTAVRMQTSQKLAVPIQCCITQKGFCSPLQSTQIALYESAKTKYANIDSIMEAICTIVQDFISIAT